MSYLVLARKYRPQVFEDVVGQSQVTHTLANAISSGRVAHAYLFCGPRGVGKTTAARILAKALNCVGPEGDRTEPSPVPCNECDPCRDITDGRSMDVLEIDGASNRGIDEIRELRENARYAPSARNKVYIVDEVHMLTKEAFNALLKTLEEPPSHVVFVLATTDPFKVPGTILSRCQRFDFARIPARDIAAHLQAVLAKEKVKAAPEALAVIARRAQGGLRDALSLTDQILSAAEGPIDRAFVETTLGLVGEDFFFALADAVADGDAGAALERLGVVYAGGAGLEDVARGLSQHLRDLYLLRLDRGLDDLLEATPGEVPRYREQAAKFSPEVLGELLERSAAVTADLRRAEQPRLLLELALVEMCRAAEQVPLGELAARLLDLEQRLGGAPAPARPAPRARTEAPPPAPARPAAPKKSERATPPPAPRPTPVSAAGEDDDDPAPAPSREAVPAGDAVALWARCLEELKGTSIRFWGTLQTVTATGLDEDGTLVLASEGASLLQGEALKDPECHQALEAALSAAGSSKAKFRLAGTEPAEKPKKPRARKQANPAPADEAKDERSMGEIFQQEPTVQKVLDMFDGEVLE